MVDNRVMLKVLKAIRESGPITNREICEDYLDIPYANDSSGPLIREIVEAARKQGHFIAADQRGYWYEDDPEGQQEYLRRLASRIRSTQETYDALRLVATPVPELFAEDMAKGERA